MEYIKDLKNERTIAVDTETTGLSPKENSLLSIGAVDLATGDTFKMDCRVQDGRVVNDKALEVNGFTKEEIYDKSKPTAEEAVEEFEKFVKDHKAKVLIGYNFSFDLSFLYYAKYKSISAFKITPQALDLEEVMLKEVLPNDKLYPLSEKEKVEGRFPSLNASLNYFNSPDEMKPHISLTGALESAELYCLMKYKHHFIETINTPLPPIYNTITIPVDRYIKDISLFVKEQ
jgi:DNA polymerase III epsilon subunit-like protein